MAQEVVYHINRIYSLVIIKLSAYIITIRTKHIIYIFAKVHASNHKFIHVCM